jgi:hypothetical protein
VALHRDEVTFVYHVSESGFFKEHADLVERALFRMTANGGEEYW